MKGYWILFIFRVVDYVCLLMYLEVKMENYG